MRRVESVFGIDGPLVSTDAVEKVPQTAGPHLLKRSLFQHHRSLTPTTKFDTRAEVVREFKLNSRNWEFFFDISKTRSKMVWGSEWLLSHLLLDSRFLRIYPLPYLYTCTQHSMSFVANWVLSENMGPDKKLHQHSAASGLLLSFYFAQMITP
jgi:hypothetical protein